jgi:hypothetical protein
VAASDWPETVQSVTGGVNQRSTLTGQWSMLTGPRLGLDGPWSGPVLGHVGPTRPEHVSRRGDATSRARSQNAPWVHRSGPRWTRGCWSTDPWFGLRGPRPPPLSLPLVYVHPAQAVDASPPLPPHGGAPAGDVLRHSPALVAYLGC